MYESQTKSKSWRQIERIYGSYFDLERMYSQLYQKYFKTHYNGKPTKKYLKIANRINQGERFLMEEINRLYVYGI